MSSSLGVVSHSASIGSFTTRRGVARVEKEIPNLSANSEMPFKLAKGKINRGKPESLQAQELRLGNNSINRHQPAKRKSFLGFLALVAAAIDEEDGHLQLLNPLLFRDQSALIGQSVQFQTQTAVKSKELLSPHSLLKALSRVDKSTFIVKKVTGKAAWQGVRIGPSEWYFSSGLAKAILLMAELLMNSPFDLEENRQTMDEFPSRCSRRLKECVLTGQTKEQRNRKQGKRSLPYLTKDLTLQPLGTTTRTRAFTDYLDRHVLVREFVAEFNPLHKGPVLDPFTVT
ncbi:translation initiation factor 2 subunit beta [Striga asiatica]|uniref:Translation initiation factor 2 subunit beta n=1 Tax=Striga asiatica TaxID=4170 RepID=A0A5A7PZX9_STRAF|nr:translation initiation factor 2 subunit beta [Striga asiatica]